LKRHFLKQPTLVIICFKQRWNRTFLYWLPNVENPNTTCCWRWTYFVSLKRDNIQCCINQQYFQGKIWVYRYVSGKFLPFKMLHIQHTSDTYRTVSHSVRNYSLSIRIKFFFLKILNLLMLFKKNPLNYNIVQRRIYET